MNYPSWIPHSYDTPFICEWGSCTQTPGQYIIFGCLNQHLDELVLCKQHADVWVRTLPSLRCPCGEPVDTFQPVPVRTIHSTWADGLLRDQNARRAGKYLSGVGLPTTVNTTVVKPTGAITPFTQHPRKIGKWKSMKDMEAYYKYPERRGQ